MRSRPGVHVMLVVVEVAGLYFNVYVYIYIYLGSIRNDRAGIDHCGFVDIGSDDHDERVAPDESHDHR